MLAIMILQAAAPAAGQTPPIDFNLPSGRVSATCIPRNDEEVVVCGRRDANDRYRIRPLDTARFEPRRRAETTLAGDLKGAAEVESKKIGPGLTSNRVMIRLKLPF